MVQFQHTRSTCRVLGCFSESASQAVWKKEHKSMFWWGNINGGYRQKRFFSFSGGKSRLFHSLSWYMTNLLLRGFLTRLPSVRQRSRYPAKTLQISLRNVSNLSHPLRFFLCSSMNCCYQSNHLGCVWTKKSVSQVSLGATNSSDCWVSPLSK